MLIGIAGASGTGKTTLAEAVAKQLGARFVRASITELGKSVGADPVSKMNVVERLQLQERMLAAFIQKLEGLDQSELIIMDRTPLDMVGYMMAEINMHSHLDLSPELMKRADIYVAAAQRATAMFYDHIFLTSILPEYEAAETRPDWNPAYQRHVHLLIHGAAYASPVRIPFARFVTTDLNERVKYTVEHVGSMLNAERDEAMRFSTRAH